MQIFIIFCAVQVMAGSLFIIKVWEKSQGYQSLNFVHERKMKYTPKNYVG